MKTFSLSMVIMLLAMLGLFSNTSNGQIQKKQPDKIKANVINFLTASEELTNYSLNGFTTKFTENFISIPSEIKTELDKYFPAYKFYIAKMLVSIDIPARNYNLILITNSKSTEVESFIWGKYWVIRPSKSLSQIFKTLQAKSKEDAIAQVRSFAKLIAFTNNDKIGAAKIQNGKVKVELIRGEGVFSIVEVEINKNLRFGNLVITDPNGRKLRYFV